MISRYLSVLSLAMVVIVVASTASQAAIVPAAPKLSASSYLLIDYRSGRILAQENIHQQVEPASLTKMMTAYAVANELKDGKIELADMVTVSEKAWRMEGSKMFIEVGKQVSVDDLLKGVIIQSGNDASVALAEHVAGTEEVFVTIMNQYAVRLGMENTHFMNSSGLPHEDHYTTAWDMALLASALIRDFPEIYSYHSMREFTFNGITQQNRNEILGKDSSVDGIKTGHTESAGYCLVASAQRDDMRLISVVMGTSGTNVRVTASLSLLNYGFRFFETHKLYSANDTVVTSRIWKGEADTVNMGINEDLWLTVPHGEFKKLQPVVETDSTIIAPLEQGTQAGTLKVSLGDEELATRPLIVLETVREGGLIDRLRDDVILMFQ